VVLQVVCAGVGNQKPTFPLPQIKKGVCASPGHHDARGAWLQRQTPQVQQLLIIFGDQVLKIIKEFYEKNKEGISLSAKRQPVSL
jgi:hypothetical protein